MAIRDKIRNNAAHLLEPGEKVQAVFWGQTVDPYWVLVTYWIIIAKNAYRTVIVTDRRILVCRSGRLSTTQAREIVHELPRATAIGPATGLWYRTDRLGDTLYIHKRFHKDVAHADALRSGVGDVS